MKTERGDAHGIPSFFATSCNGSKKELPEQGECPSGEFPVKSQIACDSTNIQRA